MALILKQYKLPTGDINFPMLFEIPSADRIPALYKHDFLRATALVGMAVASAFDRMKFKKKPDGVLVNNLVEEIIDSADEDNLSMEDLLLFLQRLVRGKYGNFEDVSIPRFMNLFDGYRDERWDEGVRLRDSKNMQYQGLGNASRTNEISQLQQQFSKFASNLHELKTQLAETRKESNVIKMADKFYGDQSK
jgi:hypothetical protein